MKGAQAMMRELPKGWTSFPLKEVVFSRKGKKPSAVIKQKEKGYSPYLLIDELEGKPARAFTNDPKVPRATERDVLLVWDGSIGKCASGLSGAVGSTIAVLSPKEGLNTKFLEYFIKQSKNYILATSTGTGLQHINKNLLKTLQIPLPPEAEQQKIAEKLEKILTQLTFCSNRFKKVKIILKRFRQSVLMSACSGRLTADWRVSGSVLKPLDRDDARDFPISWHSTTLGKLTSLITSGSRGWAKYYSKSGSIFIRAQNINADFLNLEDIAFVKLPANTEGLRTRVLQNDLLITITGANVTKSALVEQSLKDAYVSQHVALIRPTEDCISKFLFYYIISPNHGRKQLLAAAYGQGKPGLNLNNIKDVSISLPPKAEQEEIVARVEKLLKFADLIEARYSKAIAQVDKLVQSVFAKAFRGELYKASEEKTPQQTKPNLKTESNQSSDVVYFRSIVPSREERYVNCVPSLDLEIAAGAFGEDQRPNFNEWVEINTSRPLKKGMFVAKVVGRSMEPLIPDGAHCLFQFKAPQLRNDMIAVFQLHDSEDPESGGHYTVKRLRAYRQNTDEGVVRKAKLIPENPAFQPITVDEDNVKFIAEFLEVLQPLAKAENRSVRGGHV
jgi:restriction endonuclease S subunit